MNLGGDRGHSGHKGYCLAAMVDILCAVLSGGKWGPTVDGFTTNKLQAAYANGGAAATGDGRAKRSGNDDGAEEEESTGIGHFFGAMRIDGFRAPRHFKSTIDLWIDAFRNVPQTQVRLSRLPPACCSLSLTCFVF
jgi:L-2-hydroxycarboxylate dehydrogenase (NAD+)